MDKLLTKKDLAERFQVSTTTIGRWVDDGIIPTLAKRQLSLSNYFIPSTFRVGSKFLINRQMFINWLDKVALKMI